MPGQTPTADGPSTDFKPSLAPIPASGLAPEPAADALGQTPLKAAPKPKGGNLKGKGAKRTSVANLGAPAHCVPRAATAAPPASAERSVRPTARLNTGADPDMLAAMAEAGMGEDSGSEVRSPLAPTPHSHVALSGCPLSGTQEDEGATAPVAAAAAAAAPAPAPAAAPAAEPAADQLGLADDV
jgi:hypothetical protein